MTFGCWVLIGPLCPSTDLLTMVTTTMMAATNATTYFVSDEEHFQKRKNYKIRIAIVSAEIWFKIKTKNFRVTCEAIDKMRNDWMKSECIKQFTSNIVCKTVRVALRVIQCIFEQSSTGCWNTKLLLTEGFRCPVRNILRNIHRDKREILR